MPVHSSEASDSQPRKGRGRGGSAKQTDLGLPVVQPRRATSIKKSKSGRRRAVVLAFVQLLIFLHIGVWLLSQHYGWFGGMTISPVEPSEGMALTRNGIINAGAIFFIGALLSTLILGRWFCGWGCHLVLLQDLCGWIMKRFGVRPKAFRTRFLIYTPVALVLYMYIWPLVYRFLWIPLVGDSALPWPGFSIELTTSHFWETFPGIVIGVLTLVVCGFATVYFLGAKGFCTYGCPYGGAFAPLDRLAIGRIRVTDSCEQCGHCTAVCTSNVRVHEEVREFGMVVDPGCMKCLDCVSVCPNDALYFGLGRPSLAKGKPKNKKIKRNYDLTLAEEFGLAVLMVALFWIFRGSYGTVSMLLAVGIASIVIFIFWKTWRMFRNQSVNFLHAKLRYKGKLKFTGGVFILLSVVLLALSVQLGLIRFFDMRATYHESFVDTPVEALLQFNPPTLSDEEFAHLKAADQYLTWSSGMASGGIGFIDSRLPVVAMRRARVSSLLGQWDKAEAILEDMASSRRATESVIKFYGRVLAKQGRNDEIWLFNEQILKKRPEFSEIASALAQYQISRGQNELAIETLRNTVEASPYKAQITGQLIQLLIYSGELDEAADRLEIALENSSANPAFWEQLSIVRARQEQGAAALDAMRRVTRLHPAPVESLRRLAQMEIYFGEPGAGAESFRKADQLEKLLSGPSVNQSKSAYQVEIAMWQAREGRYVASVIAFQKAVVEFLQERAGQ
ncbi:MAG: 4Fe-4S binding protein [Phycisphaerales bacterium]|nr:4Fe-4S binding protein [Phycisphaerales bacterium]